jgi:hypothetical protein
VIAVGVVDEIGELILLAVALVVLGAVWGLAFWVDGSREESIIERRGDGGGEVTGETHQRRATPPPTPLNGILAGMMVLVILMLFDAIFLSKSMKEWTLFTYGAYAVLLAFGVWRVRPKHGRERLFAWVMLPVAIQFAAYLVIWVVWTWIIHAERWPDSLPLTTFFCLWWVGHLMVAWGLFTPILFGFYTCRPDVLLFAEVFGPLLVFGSPLIDQVIGD